MTFSAADKWVFVALLVIALASFGRDISGRLRFILQGKPEPGPRLDQPARRALRVVGEVLFQTRVIRGRPIVGTLHAAVFLGFSSFSLVTVNHVLRPFGIHFLRAIFGRDGEHIFNWVLGVIAVAVMVGMLGLAYRRFVMVKISPGPKSVTSGIVAVLIVLLMLTYLNSVSADEIAPKANWWLHTVILLVFPSVILRSKHLHILFAPVTIFLRQEQLGNIRPLDLEAIQESEDENITLGLETVADMPWKLRLDLQTCVECRRCTDQCPANGSGQELDPRAFILGGRKMLGQDGEPVIGTVISERALGQCTTCGACENACPVGIEHLQLVVGAKRAQALATGEGMVAADMIQTVERYGNPFGVEKSARAKLIERLNIPIYEPGKTEYLLWLGCVWTFNTDAHSSLESTMKLLDKAGVSYGVLEQESCSGHHQRRQGEEMQFQTLAGENIERIKEGGVQKVVTGCAHCLNTLRHEYTGLDESFKVDVTHHSELLSSLVENKSLTLKPVTGGDVQQVTYHDPCYLGRYEGVFEAPRRVIQGTGHNLLELGRTREKSFCCGGGGGGFVREPSEEWRVDQERKREIAGSGAQVLVTGCPQCKMMLNAAVEKTVDLAELLASSVEGID